MALIDYQAPEMNPTTLAPPSTYQAARSEPILATQDTSKGTVAGQVKSIIDSYSPLMQQAEAGANQQMNARGLINTSIGLGAAQGALYGAALPIAQADAASTNQFTLANAEIGNRANEFNASAQNQAGQFNVGQENTFKTNQANLEQDTAKTNLDIASKTLWQQMDTDTKLQMANIEADYKTLIQADAAVGTVYQEMLKSITTITTNKDMDAQAKQAAVDQQVAAFKQFANLTAAMNNLDMSQLLDFNTGGVTGGTGTPDAGTGTGASTAPSTLPRNTPGLPTNPSAGQLFNYNGVQYQYLGRGATLFGQPSTFGGKWEKV